MKILNGRETSEEVKKEIRIEVEEFSSNQMRAPHLAAILVGNNGSEIKTLASNIKKFIPNNRQIIINIIEVENVNSNASLIADLVVQQLEDRVAFRRAIREGLKCAQDNEVNGIKIQVSGRLNGAEIARSEWIREGRVPLQTLRADIDYATKEANTIYGVLGVKVWLFKNEILKK